MGYYTDYDFSDNSDEIIKQIEEISGYGKSDNGRYQDIKWYDWKEHMLQVSLKNPEEIIFIEGKGEEQGDVWKAFFKNGKCKIVQAEMSFPEFSLNDLT